ncbi:Imm1 family immunity protein [Kribbella sp. NPDC051587]|uniref:Imm1 family immunity protein n=1 Tax=Kribbella sp. NPDC051587 TaxID=3364119 RepID=UPI00378E7679
MKYEYTISAHYKPGETVAIVDDKSAAAFLDHLVLDATRSVDSSAATLIVNERRKDADGLPDHQLIVGVDPASKSGGLAYTDRQGTVYAIGRMSDRDEVVYLCHGYAEQFPQNSVLDLTQTLTAIKDMLRTGERPQNLNWAPMPAAEGS